VPRHFCFLFAFLCLKMSSYCLFSFLFSLQEDTAFQVARDYQAEKEDEKTREADGKDDAKQKKGGQKRKRPKKKKTKKKTNKKRKVETSGSDTRVEDTTVGESSSSSSTSSSAATSRSKRKDTINKEQTSSSSSSSSSSSPSSNKRKTLPNKGGENKKVQDKKRASKKRRTSEMPDRGPLIADLRPKIEEKNYPGTEQPDWYEEHWRHKVQVTVDPESMTLVRFRSAIWRRDDYGDRKAKQDVWKNDTFAGIATAHRLTRAAVQGLLARLMEALRSGDEIRDHTWTEDVADGAKTRSGKETTEMIETDTVSLRRCILTIDIISLVSYLMTQIEGTLCLPLACVNALSGIITLKDIVDCSQFGIPKRGQTRQCLQDYGVVVRVPVCFEKKTFKQGSQLTPSDCLVVFADAVRNGTVVGRFAVKVSGAHWLTIVVRDAGPGGAIIIDSDPSHPEPVPFTGANLLGMGYAGILDIWQLILTAKGTDKLEQLKAVQAKLR
jgi:hypothetical protein